MIPTAEETPKAKRTEEKVTWAGKKLLIKSEPKKPRIMPIAPPRAERMTASIRNWIKVARG